MSAIAGAPRRERVADIFISYTSSDRDWAFWIAKELEALGHTPHVHEWEITGGDDIYAWMEARHDTADHVLCVVSDEYLNASKFYSQLERRAALWQAAGNRPGFALLVVVAPCKLPTLSDHIRHCELFGMPEDAARVRFREFMATPTSPDSVTFPGKVLAVSNIPVRVPIHFMGREDALAAIEIALQRDTGRVAITALHGLRGVGKTTLAAGYAERHRGDYRATWWIRAQSEPTMRADLVALGVRLGWVPPDDKEEPALAAVMERLRHEGEGILLIFDNAIDADALKPYLPRGGAARVLVTSNAHAWRGVAERVEIRIWPKAIGADYLIARTGRTVERAAAEALSEALGGLPLAHEQAAAYCERLEIPLAEYRRRFAAAPVQMLDAGRDAPAEYHDKLTVAKTFALAIDEAAKLHPAAEPLIVHAALLALEPIPLFLFSEAREKFGELLASALAGDGLDEAVAALRAFALVDREPIVDEREPAVVTDTIRLHRLVREIAAAQCTGETREQVRRALVEALAELYGGDIADNPKTWPRARRLDGLALELVGGDAAVPRGTELSVMYLMNQLAIYRTGVLGAYAPARPFFERVLALSEKLHGPEHPATGASLGNLAYLLQEQGDLGSARPLYERALSILEKELGPEHPDTATSLDNLACLLLDEGEFTAARPLVERALAIREKQLGPDHPHTARSLNNLGLLLLKQRDLAAARPLVERALTICEKSLGKEHPLTATSLNNLAFLLREQGDLSAARPLYERVQAIWEKTLGNEHPRTVNCLYDFALLLREQGDLSAARLLLERALVGFEKMLGPDHPYTARCLHSLARLLFDQGELSGARPLYERALAIRETGLGPDHPHTANSLNDLAELLDAQDEHAAARPLYERVLAICEKALGPDHPDTATSLGALAHLLQAQGELAAARPLFERALAIYERVLGPDHPDTARSLNNLALLLHAQGELHAARQLYERGLVICEKALGPDHPDTATTLRNLANMLLELGDLAAARPLYERALAIREKALGPDHPDTARSLYNLAYLLQAQGNLVAARPLYERALAIYEKALGPDHPITARVRNDLASLLRDGRS
jgi:tetratricopeptide (TPR) repeat protein